MTKKLGDQPNVFLNQFAICSFALTVDAWRERPVGGMVRDHTVLIYPLSRDGHALPGLPFPIGAFWSMHEQTPLSRQSTSHWRRVVTTGKGSRAHARTPPVEIQVCRSIEASMSAFYKICVQNVITAGIWSASASTAHVHHLSFHILHLSLIRAFRSPSPRPQ